MTARGVVGLMLGLTVSVWSGQAQPPLQISVVTERTYSCSQPGMAVVLGSVLEAGKTSFSLDRCLPTQDCRDPVRATFSVSAPGFAGFDRYLRKDGFVRVRFEILQEGAVCRRRILMQGIANWLGAPNPSGDGGAFYFAGNEGITEAFPEAPYSAERCPGGRTALLLKAERATPLTVTPRHRPFTWPVESASPWSVVLHSAGSCSSGDSWSYRVAGAPRPGGP